MCFWTMTARPGKRISALGELLGTGNVLTLAFRSCEAGAEPGRSRGVCSLSTKVCVA
ncbi:hypothetical protein ACRRTK_005183 [Alexandromys fortis]